MKLPFARTLLAGVAAVAGLAIVTPSTASAQIGFVAQADYGSDTDFGVGGGIRFDLGKLTTQNGIRGEATFDYFFPSCSGCGGNGSLKYWEINGNGMLDIKSVPGLYVGAGARYYNTSYSYDAGYCGILVDCSAGDTGVGLNLIGGWNFGGKNSPFVQGKFELGNGDQFVVSGGIRF